MTSTSAGRTFSCKRCGRTFNKRRSLTRRGYCPSGCGFEVRAEVNDGIKSMRGPWAEHWLEGILRVVGDPSPGGYGDTSDDV